MHRGYWGIIAAFGLAVIVFLSLGVGAYFGALNAPNHSYETKETTQNTSKNERANPSQIDRDRAGLPKFVERIASAPDPENADEREKRDLAAQEAAALWGFWMLVASAAGTVTTMIGTGFLLWQITLTREAVEDTGDATKAMLHANKIAETAQRPYLHIYGMTWERSDFFDAWYFIVNVKNFGQTPARDFTIMADVRYSLERQPPSIWRVEKCEASDIIPQNKVERILVRCHDTRTGDINNRLYLEDTYCRFELRYKDSFGNQYGLFETHGCKRARNGGDDTFRFHSSP